MIGTTVKQYKILERIGAGGMGIVYKAEDTRLGRTVALKFLPPYALDSEEDKTRFLIEAQSAAALDHPNICTIHEIGDVGEHQFIVMAYVAGPSLKERLKDGAIEPAEAINIAGQVASGLSKAHEKGIIHRDIKPANILLAEGGLVKVCDFGLAKSSISKKITRTGSTMGTAAYMSPEQARSEPVNQRTDIWSLGVVLYEMLAGNPPFMADHEAVVIYAILNDDYPPLEEKRPGLPSALYEIVRKALAHKSANRYVSMEEMRLDLKAVASQIKEPSTISGTYPVVQPSSPRPSKPVAAPEQDTVMTKVSPPKPASKPESEGKRKSSPILYVVIGALTIAAVLVVVRFNMKPTVEGPPEERAALPPPAIAPPEAAGDAETTTKSPTRTAEQKLPVIAVLYLENPGKKRDDEYLAAGFTQELIDALSGIKKAKVMSRFDVLPLRGMPLAVDDFGKRLGADYLLEGAIQKDKKQIRLTAHLHRVADRDLVWSLRYDRPAGEIFAVQTEIADSVAKALAITLAPEERQSMAVFGTSNADAYDQCLRGRYAFERRTEDDNESAEEAFRRALSLDKDFTDAKIGLARTLLQQIDWGWDNNEKLIVEAAGLLERAALRDTASGEYFLGVGVLSAVRNDVSGAIRAHRRAVQLTPQDPDAHYRLGIQLATVAQSEEAGREFRRAIELKSDYVDAHLWLARVATFTGKPGDAEKSIATALDVSPKQARVRVAAGLNSFYKGDFAAADLQVQNAIALRPRSYRQKGTAGIIVLFQRRVPDAVSLLKEACVKVKDWRFCLRLAQAYQLSGKSSQADKALNDALAEATEELGAHPGDLETEYGRLYIRCLQGDVKDPDVDFKRLALNTQKTLDQTIRYYYTAAIDAHFGQIDRAIESIERVLKLNVYAPAYIGADPMFVKLKNDSRFQKLVGIAPSS
jgi:serine/threonine-protein kinase